MRKKNKNHPKTQQYLSLYNIVKKKRNRQMYKTEDTKTRHILFVCFHSYVPIDLSIYSDLKINNSS